MIVIPMAGLSTRFKNAGYEKPKYMLPVNNKTLFEYSVLSFQKYFCTESFLFISLDIQSTGKFIEAKCKQLGIAKYQIITLDRPTKGQAETVYLGLKEALVPYKEKLVIFNIDTFRPNYSMPDIFTNCEISGYIETFKGAGKNWSNVVPVSEKSDKVQYTAEKKELSEFCCTRIYAWTEAGEFCEIYEKYSRLSLDVVDGGEYYIAPMYNESIKSGKDIRYTVIDRDSVIFCGVPDEYINLIDSLDLLEAYNY